MSVGKLILRSLCHYWRAHLWLLAGIALAAAVLGGSLVVGDSVKASLRAIAETRLGKVETVLAGGERFFREGLAAEVGGAPVLLVRGTVSMGDERVPGVNVLGVDERFWEYGESGKPPVVSSEPIVNRALALRMGAGVGDEILIRVEVPGALPRDIPLSGATDDSETTASVRGKVSAVADSAHSGAFSLRNEQAPALNVFVPLGVLQEKLKRVGRANLVLGRGLEPGVFEDKWTLDDAGLSVAESATGEAHLATTRIFMDPDVEAAADGDGVLTYLINGIKKPGGETETPYSMVTSVGRDRASIFGDGEVAEDAVVVTQWLADDLGLAVGDTVAMRYLVGAEEGGLAEGSANFVVTRILPMDTPGLSPDWTPNFPGISENADCRDWDPGFEMDLAAIRDKDEDYWDTYRATPKAFIPLVTGQRLWKNRFGDLTGVRKSVEPEAFAEALRSKLTLDSVGIMEVDVRGQAQNAVGKAMDFGGLFIGLSFFLVVAALALAGLLFAFGTERRFSQIGLLLATGIPAKRVRAALLGEAAVIALVGALIGTVLGLLYTKLALAGLNGGWSGAVAGAELRFSASAASLLTGWLATALIAVGLAWWVVRKAVGCAPRALLAGAVDEKAGKRPRFAAAVAVVALLSGVILAFLGRGKGGTEAAGFFFGGGALLLIAGLAAMRAWLGRSVSKKTATSMTTLGLRNARRRPGRSLAVAGVMAAGVFLVVSVNAFRLSVGSADKTPAGGTGGFAWFAQSALPVYGDLAKAADLDPDEATGLSVVAMRTSEGDDASCLNLNRAQQPTVLGVDRGAFDGRFTFTDDANWAALEGRLEDGAIPAIADEATALWALQKKIGDELLYPGPDGELLPVRFVGLVRGTLLQGRILVSTTNFKTLFPDVGGVRTFLFDAPEGTEKLLESQLRARGFIAQSAGSKLAEFQAVQNTYLGIFTLLGGFGILLGTVGLAIVVARNVLERRGELGLLKAVGYRPGMLRSLVLAEHAALHVGGVLLGTVAAIVAVLPAVSAPGGGLPAGLLTALVGGVLVAGLVFCAIAARLALRGPLVDAIRDE